MTRSNAKVSAVVATITIDKWIYLCNDCFELWLTFNPILYGKVEFMTSASNQWHLHSFCDALIHCTIVTNKANNICFVLTVPLKITIYMTYMILGSHAFDSISKERSKGQRVWIGCSLWSSDYNVMVSPSVQPSRKTSANSPGRR